MIKEAGSRDLLRKAGSVKTYNVFLQTQAAAADPAEKARRSQVFLLQREHVGPVPTALVVLAGRKGPTLAGPESDHHRWTDYQHYYHTHTDLVSLVA